MGEKNSSESRHGGKGAPRKSRRRRLWISGTLGAPPEWTPTDDDWRLLEAAYEKPFNDEIRAEIGEIVRKYFYWATFEPTAPFADEFIKKLAKARKLASELENVVHSFGDAGQVVAPYWERYFPREEERTADGPHGDDNDALWDWATKQPTPRERHRRFSEMVHIIYSALDDTLREVSSDDAPAFEEGECWKQLIIDLGRALEKRDFEITTSNDRNHRTSSFVAFVKGLQSTFDESLRRHTSIDALCSEINKARRQIRNRSNQQPGNNK